MKISSVGISLIEQFEGERLNSYQDGNGVWTIGYGHTGPDVHIGGYETQAQAEENLCADLGTAEVAVGCLVKVPLTQCQFDALVSFTYNEGQGRLAGSTMLKLINAGSLGLAAREFLKWNLIDGAPSPGLERRRHAEMNLFEGAVQ